MIIGEDQNGLIKIWIKFPCDGYYLRWWYNGWHYWYFLPGTISFDTEGENYYTLGTQKIAMCSGQITYSQCQAIRTILNSTEIDIWTDVGWKSTRLERDSVIVYDNKVDGYEIEFVMILGSRHISDSGYSPNYVEPPIGPPIDPPIPPPVYVSDCPNGNCVIGTQVWMSCNWDVAYPGSRVYDDDEANRTILGGLYTWDQVNASGLVPTGWHVPTETEWDILIAALGGAAVAGGSLKDSGTTYWVAPNSVATPVSCFEARGAGYFHTPYHFYTWLDTGTVFWTATEATALNGRYVQLNNDSTAVLKGDLTKADFCSVRLIRNTPATPVDTGLGALYNWFAASSAIKSGGALYNWWVVNNHTHGTNAGDIYGALYNWFAVDTGLLAPTGWHIPTYAECVNLITGIGGFANGGELKEIGTVYWDAPNLGATNNLLFNARGSGYRDGATGAYQGNKFSLNIQASDLSLGKTRGLNLNNTTAWLTGFVDANGSNSGYSIRCLLDGVDPADPGSVTDIDGNTYATVKIGTQVWMAENLKVTHYNDGTPIPIVTGNALWAADTAGAMCYYNDEAPTGNIYLLPPSGWHVPTSAEYSTLVTQLGGTSVAGGHLKEAGITNWLTPNTGADNSSGFTAKGSGFRSQNGLFIDIKILSIYHSSDDYQNNTSYAILLQNNQATAMPWGTVSGLLTKRYGASIRLIKDDDVDPGTLTDEDGNVYPTVKIGNQVWMAADLKVTSYNDSSAITEVTNAAAWAALSTEAMCYYDNIP